MRLVYTANRGGYFFNVLDEEDRTIFKGACLSYDEMMECFNDIKLNGVTV